MKHITSKKDQLSNAEVDKVLDSYGLIHSNGVVDLGYTELNCNNANAKDLKKAIEDIGFRPVFKS